MKDEDDRMLESMFASQPIADSGFSSRVLRRVRRRIWVQRLTIPIATMIGLAISFKPIVGVLTSLAGFVKLIPQNVISVPMDALPQLPMIVLGAMLLATCMVGLRALED